MNSNQINELPWLSRI